MKKLVTLALLGLLAAGNAGAVTSGINAVEQNGYCLNSKTGQLVDCITGAAILSDAARDRDYGCEFNSIISKAFVPQTGVDSSAVLFTGDCKRWWLQVSVTGFGSGAAIPWASFGIRVRSHAQGISDSLNTFMWDPTPQLLPAGATLVDSLAYGAINKALISAYGPTEIKLTAVADNGVAVAEASWNSPHNYLIPLKDSAGNWYEGQWTSVWVRSTGASANVNHTVTVNLVGKP